MSSEGSLLPGSALTRTINCTLGRCGTVYSVFGENSATLSGGCVREVRECVSLSFAFTPKGGFGQVNWQILE